MSVPAVHVALPEWLESEIDRDAAYPDDEAKLSLAIRLAHRNIGERSGGPFAAIVFDEAERIVAAGVNRVLPERTSLAHAEMLAFSLAQARLDRARLNEDGRRYTLATSAQPCAMCYGASFWAGVDTIVIGARAEDVTALSDFDEGPLPADWIGELARRGIEVRRDVLREEACEVFRAYARIGGRAY